MAASSIQHYVSNRIQTPRPSIQDFCHDDDNQCAESSLDDPIYIFPNPSSIPPSPSQRSDLSVVTNFTFSGISELQSLSDSVSPSYQNGLHDLLVNHSPLTPLTPLDGVVQLESPRGDANEISLGSPNLIKKTDLWHGVPVPVRRPRGSSGPSSSHLTGREDFTLYHSQIPFFSFLVPLLSLDHATVHILSHSTSHSILFPGHVSSSDNSHLMDEYNAKPHGVEKLMMWASYCRTANTSYVATSDSSFISYTLFPSLPFPGLWDFVSGFMGNSSKALREVLRAT